MRQLERLWAVLDSTSGLVLPIAQWEESLGEDFDFGLQFLRSAGELVDWWPCSNNLGDGCPRRVLPADDGRFIALCGNEPKECDPVWLHRQALVLHEFRIERLADKISRALGLDTNFERHPHQPGVWILGNKSFGDRDPAIVCLVVSAPSDDLRSIVVELLREIDGPLIVTTPTAHGHTSRLQRLVANSGARLVPLNAVLALDADVLVSVAPLDQPRPATHEDETPAREAGIIRRKGRYWEFQFKGPSVLLTAPYGPLYVVHLLLRPYQWVPVTELVRIRSRLAHLPTLGSAGGATDTIALRQYRRHLETIEAAMAVAEAEDNAREIKDLTEDKLLLEAHLASVVGYRGRIRIHSEDVERFRKSVAGALERTYKAIEEADHPLLAQHLRTFITMGRTLSYRPIPPVDWLQE